MSGSALMMDGMAVRKQVLCYTKNMQYAGLVVFDGVVAESSV